MSRADQSLTRQTPAEVSLGVARSGSAAPSAFPAGDERADLELVVEPRDSGRSSAATSRRRASGPDGRRTAVPLAHDRRRAAVIPDRHPLVVRQQRRCPAGTCYRRSSRDGSRRRSRCSRRSATGSSSSAPRIGTSSAGALRARARPAGVSARSRSLSATRSRWSAGASERQQRVERALATHASIASSRSRSASSIAAPARRDESRIRSPIATAGRRRASRRGSTPSGRFWIGKSVVGFVRRFDPRAQLAAVRLVECVRHSRPSARRPSTGSWKEHDPNARPSELRALAICRAVAVRPRHSRPNLAERNAVGVLLSDDLRQDALVHVELREDGRDEDVQEAEHARRAARPARR